LVDPPGLTLPTEDWDRITLDEHPQADLRGRPSNPLELWPQGRHLLQGHLDWPLRIGGLCQVDARFRCTDYGGPELHICPQRVLQRFSDSVSVTSKNVFKKDPGIAGVGTDLSGTPLSD